MFFLHEDTPMFDTPIWGLSIETMWFDVTVRNIHLHELEDLRDQITKEIDKLKGEPKDD
jgi:hypothetical protein